MKKTCIQVRNLSYTYENSSRPALGGLDFDIHEGEYLAVLGANGSGKSTLLKCLNGLCTPPRGSVLVYGRDGSPLDPADEEALEGIRRTLGTVMQNSDDQIVGVAVEEDAAFGPENLGLPADEVRRRVDEALAAVNLAGFRDRAPQFLSGGERQRLTLAGVLALGSEIIALDEAASMLDPAGRESLLGLLEGLHGAGKTILHVTHSLDEAFYARRCLVLFQGKLVFDGPPRDLPGRPELAAWGFTLPESLKAVRALSRLFPGFSAVSLDPEKTAEALRPFCAAAGGAGASAGAAEARRAAAPGPETGAGCIVRFDGVSHRYLKGTVHSAMGISGVSCGIPRNASVALIGKSGSGKSTVLKHINALLLPSAGSVRVFGKDTLDKKNELRALRLNAGLAVQSPESALFETYVADDAAYGPRNAGLKGPALVERVKRALEAAGLPYGEFADRETGSLSGGEKRRAAIAGVLALDSEILLLDEPTAALDGKGREGILAMIGEQKRAGKTIIATTHSMGLAASFDLIGVMDQGRLAAFGPPRDLFGPGWDPRWGMRLPWAAAVAHALARLGCPLPGEVPLNAEELLARIGALREAPAEGGGAAPHPPPGAGPGPGVPHLPLPRRRTRKKTELAFFRNVTLGLFLDRPSFLRRLGAGKKLCVLLMAATLAIAGPQPAASLGISALALLAGALAGRVGPRHLLRGLIPALPYMGILVFFQLVFAWPQDYSPVLVSLGPLSVTMAEINRSLALLCRYGALLTLLSLYTAVTPLRETLRAIVRALKPLSRFGIPGGDIALAIGIALRFVPVLTEEAERIVAAQLSRGGGKGKIRTALAMVAPLFLRALERSETLAKAMVLRLYHRDKKGSL
ncbi:MAG: ATP-binding cassette domain-containing protein [Treponema sp.]|nr:ATP-binding cassette domain-containing protein [Treponema sp.]